MSPGHIVRQQRRFRVLEFEITTQDIVETTFYSTRTYIGTGFEEKLQTSSIIFNNLLTERLVDPLEFLYLGIDGNPQVC